MLHEDQSLASIKGEITPLNQAVIPFSDRGFLFGEAVVEVLKVKNSRLENYQNHMQRLFLGCKKLNISTTFNDLDIIAETQRLYTKMQRPDHAYVKIMVTSGEGLSIRQAPTTKPSLYILMSKTTHTLSKPIEAKTVEAKQPFAEFKNNHLAWRSLDIQLTPEEVLYTDSQGNILCLATANIFFIKENKHIYTPRLGNILAGTTRSLVIESLKKSDYTVIEGSIKASELGEFKGAFASSSIRELEVVCKIDEVQYSDFEITGITKRYNELAATKSIALEKKL